MRGLDILKNSPVSVTKLTLGLRVGFISSHLATDKLFRVNPRAITGPPQMSLLLEAKSMLSLIFKPRLTLVAHTDDLGWNKRLTSRDCFPAAPGEQVSCLEGGGIYAIAANAGRGVDG